MEITEGTIVTFRKPNVPSWGHEGMVGIVDRIYTRPEQVRTSRRSGEPIRVPAQVRAHVMWEGPNGTVLTTALSVPVRNLKVA